MKKIVISMTAVFLFSSSHILAEEQSNPTTQQAREDYRAYLQALKGISKQYKEITSEMKEILREEGIPVWNEMTGEIEFQKGLMGDAAKSGIQETNTEMIVTIDLPGVKKNDVQVKIEDGRFLKVEAKREDIPVIKFIQLPAPADARSKPKASLENGVLIVKIVKASQIRTQVVIPVQ